MLAQEVYHHLEIYNLGTPQRLALLYFNHSDQFLHTRNRSTYCARYIIEAIINVKDQATLEMGYLKPDVVREIKYRSRSYIST
jgi:hypothetical protein